MKIISQSKISLIYTFIYNNIYIRICLHTYIVYAHTYIVYTHTYIQIYINYAFIHTYRYKNTHVCMSVYVCICMYICVCVYVCMYVYMSVPQYMSWGKCPTQNGRGNCPGGIVTVLHSSAIGATRIYDTNILYFYASFSFRSWCISSFNAKTRCQIAAGYNQ